MSAPPREARCEEHLTPFVDVARLTVSTSMSSNEAELRAQGRSWYRPWTWQAPGRAEAALEHTSMVSWVTPGTQVGGGVQESNFENPCQPKNITSAEKHKGQESTKQCSKAQSNVARKHSQSTSGLFPNKDSTLWSTGQLILHKYRPVAKGGETTAVRLAPGG